MEREMKGGFRRLLSVMLSVLTVFVMLIPNTTLIAHADGNGDAKVFNVNLGEAKLIDGSTNQFTFPNATITSSDSQKKISSMTITVSDGSIDTNGASFTDDRKDSTGKISLPHMTGTWIFTNKTVEDVCNTLKNIKFTLADNMSVTVVVDGNETNLPSSSKITTYVLSDVASGNVDGKVHYYAYVDYGSTLKFWDDAYNSAKGLSLMGMRGYLVTVTEAGEDSVLDNITTNGAWAGGARIATSYSGDLDLMNASSYSKPDQNIECYWKWVCGPESGKLINISGSTCSDYDAGSFSGKRGTDDRGIIKGDDADSYQHWRRSQNDYDKEPNDYQDGEWCLQVHFPDSSLGYYGWNDLGTSTYKSYIKGYFVEFSEYDGGMVDGYSSTLTTTTKAFPFHVHDWNFTSDDTTDTITAKCTKVSECGEPDRVFKLTAGDKTYTGEPYDVTGICDDDLTSHVKDSEIKYSYSGTDANGNTYGPTATPPTDVGEYTVTATLYVGSEQKGEPISKSFKITPATLTITPIAQNITSKGSIKTWADDKNVVSFIGLLKDETVSSITVELSDSSLAGKVGTHTDAIITKDVKVMNGTKDVTMNYNPVYGKANLTVGAPELAISGGYDYPEYTYGDNLGSQNLDIKFCIKDTDIEVPGTVVFNEPNKVPNATGNSYSSETIKFTPSDSTVYGGPVQFQVNVKVHPKEIHVDWSGTDTIYNGQSQTPTASVKADELVNGDTVTNVPLAVNVVDTNNIDITAVDADEYIAKATISNDNKNYKLVDSSSANDSSTTTFTIGKKPVVISVNDYENATYKQNLNPLLSVSYLTVDATDGLVSGEELNSASFEYNTNILGEQPGGLKVTAVTVKKSNSTTFTTDNYSFTFKPGLLKVAPNGLEVSKVPSVGDITYGDKVSDSTIGTDGVITDTKTGDVITGKYTWKETGKDDVPNAGKVTGYSLVFTPDDNNYQPIEIPVTLNVNKKDIEIKAKTMNVLVGDEIKSLKDGEYEIVSGKLVNGDKITSLDCVADTSKSTDKGTITPANAKIGKSGVDSLANYNIKYTSGVLNVGKHTLYVDKIPTASGLTYGDTLDESSLTGGVIKDANGNPISGKFVWKDPSVIPNVTDSDITDFDVIFIPDDTEKYEQVSLKVKVKVTPKVFSDNDFEPTITPDPVTGDPVVVIRDKKTKKILVEDKDYTITTEDGAEIIKITVTGKGNYSGTLKYLFKKVFAGNIEVSVNIDKKAEEFAPSLDKISDDNAKTLMKSYLLENDSLTPEQIKFAKEVIEDIEKTNNNSELGAYDTKINLDVKGVDNDAVPADEIKMIKDVIAKGKDSKGVEIPTSVTMSNYFDISLFMDCTIYDENEMIKVNVSDIKISDTSKDKFGDKAFKEKIRLKLEGSLKEPEGYSRTYYAIRVHKLSDGSKVVDVLPTQRDGDYIIIETDKFSTYAIGYTEVKLSKPAAPPQKLPAPQTSDSNLIWIGWGLTGLGFILIMTSVIIAVAKRRKNK